MKVAIFHPEFVYSGGAEKLIFRQVDYLKKAGWQVDIYSAFVDEEKCYPDLIKNYSINQILPKFLNKAIPNDVMVLLTTFFFPFFIFRFKDCDLFIGENQAGPWWAAMAAKFWSKPYATYQNYPTTVTYPREIDKGTRRNSWITNILLYILGPIIKYIDIQIIRYANISLANGEYTKGVCKRAYGKVFVNCPGAAERGEFSQKIFEKRFSGTLKVGQRQIKKPYILITNRHFPAKRLDFGIKLMSEFNAQNLKVNLVITGEETRDTTKVKVLARKLKVNNQVLFTGLVEEEELKKLYKNSLVYIYTAPEEDFGLGVLEAMSHGVPVVVWDKAGPSYIVKNGLTGYKITPYRLDEFAEKLQKLFLDKKLNFKMARAAYADVKRFSWDNHGKILQAGLQQAQDKYEKAI